MKVIDILVDIADKKEDNFKFWVKLSPDSSKDTVINWEYKDGYVTQVSNRAAREKDGFFDYIADGIYDLTDEIIIIEEETEKEIKELPCLEYIKNDEPDKLTYGSWTMPCNDTERFLSLIINRMIKEVEDLKYNMEAMDKNFKKYANHIDRRFGYAEKTYEDDED